LQRAQEEIGPQVSMAKVCEIFGLSRQAHYQKKWREQIEIKEQIIALELARQIRRKHPRMGTRKIYFKMQAMLDCVVLKYVYS